MGEESIKILHPSTTDKALCAGGREALAVRLDDAYCLFDFHDENPLLNMGTFPNKPYHRTSNNANARSITTPILLTYACE